MLRTRETLRSAEEARRTREMLSWAEEPVLFKKPDEGNDHLVLENDGSCVELFNDYLFVVTPVLLCSSYEAHLGP